jgi:hypothetical protein
MKSLMKSISNAHREDPYTMTLDLVLCSIIIIIPISVLMMMVTGNVSCLMTICQLFNFF